MAAEGAPATAPAKGTVKLFGQTVSKKTLMVAGVVAGGVLAYAYYRKSKNSASATSATGTGTAADAGNIDPVTGYPYGSAEDTAALASQQDSGLNTNTGSDIDPETGYPYDSTQDLAALGYTSTGTGSTSSGGTAAAASTTNAQWEQECIANLEAGGVAQATISDAESGLPRYLAKLSLSSAQATAVQMCVGLTGPPPVGGPYNIVAAPAPPKTPAKPAAKTVTADGKQTLDQIATANKISENDLLSLNPGNESIIRKYWGTGKPVPKGSKWKV